MAPGIPQHHLPFALEVFGDIDLAVLQLSLDVLVERHEALRTVFVDDGGMLKQSIPGPRPIVAHVDAPSGPDHELNDLLRKLVAAPFDLSREPLVRVIAVRRAPGMHILVFVLHHIIADNLSLGLFAREIADAYRALSARTLPKLSPLPWQYVDFADAESRWLNSSAFRDRLQRYTEKLGTAAARLDFGPVQASTSVDVGANHLLSIDSASADRLKQVAQRAGVTLFTVLLASLEIVLAPYAGGQDFVIAVPVAGRSSDGAESVIGPFANIVGLRTNLRAGQPIAGLLADIGRQLLDTLEYDNVPWGAVIRAINPARSIDAAPLSQVMLSSIEAPAPFQRFGPLPCRPKWLFSPAPAADLFVSVSESQDGLLWIGFDYRRDKISAQTVSRISSALRNALLEIAQGDITAIKAHPRREENRAFRSNNVDVVEDPSDAQAGRGTTETPQRRYVLEKLIAELWRDFLGNSPADTREDFFDAGGDSLLAVRFVSALSRRIDHKIPVAMFFRDPTVDGLVTTLTTSSLGCELDYATVKLVEGVDSRVLFVSSAQRGLAELAAAIPRGPSIYRLDAYFLQEQRLLAGKPMLESIEAIATELLHRLKAIQPSGPYLLAGGCEGGVILFEMALQLQCDGEDVALLAQLDTPVRGIWEPTSAIIGALREAKHRVMNAAMRLFRPPAPGFERHDRIWENIWRIVRAYSPKDRFNGDVHQFRAKPTFGIVDVASGWDDRITGRLIVHQVPGDHLDWMDHQRSALAVGALLDRVMPSPISALRDNPSD